MMYDGSLPDTDIPGSGQPAVEMLVMGDLPPERRSFSSWLRCRAALMLPMDADMMVLYDLYALGLPMFAPDPLNLLPSYVWRNLPPNAMHYHDPVHSPVRLFHNGSLMDRFPYWRPYSHAQHRLHMGGDGNGHGHGWDSMRAWTFLTDFVCLPHISFFSSFSQLWAELVDIDQLKGRSRRMIHHHKHMKQLSISVWGSVLKKALNAPPVLQSRFELESVSGSLTS